MLKLSYSEKVFKVLNYTFFIGFALLCIAPLVHILALSFSSRSAIANGEVFFLPSKITTAAYAYCLTKKDFLQSLLVSVERISIGIPVNMLLTILTAYPLSKEVKNFKWRTLYAWIFVFTMLFGGGLIPAYMIVFKTKLIDTIWALILPGAVPVFNVVLLLNFFRGIPKELEEAAFIDGAGHWKILSKIYLPLSAAALSTITLFCFIGHWNSWFDGIIYMNSNKNYPLQSYLQVLVLKTDLTSISFDKSIKDYSNLSNNNLKAAQVILGTIPIMIVYPFIQRYFTQGITLGSVKE